MTSDFQPSGGAVNKQVENYFICHHWARAALSGRTIRRYLDEEWIYFYPDVEKAVVRLETSLGD